MQATARRLTAEPLAWDSAHFGVPVGRIEIDGDESGLPDALARAEGDGLAWIYVFTPPDFAMPAEWLERFDGLKVDTRVVFRREFSDGEPVEPESHADSVIVAEAPVGRPSPALVELATAAGAFSRFGVDPRIPEDAFRRLYEIWITRSCLHETADAVLTAEDRGAPGVPMGLVTIAARDRQAAATVDAAIGAARQAPEPEPALAFTDVWADGGAAWRT